MASNSEATESIRLRNRQILSENAEREINVESGPSSSVQDLFQLKSFKKSKQELKALDTKLGRCGLTKNSIKRYYIEQNELIDELLAPLANQTEEEASKQNLKVNIAIYGSAVGNFSLVIIQLVSSILSGSQALFAIMADAFMDLFCSLILVISSHLSKKPEIYGYPSGKSRFETVGIIIFGTLMSTLSILLMYQSISSFITGPSVPEVGLLSLGLVVVAIIMKLILFFYCYFVDHPTAQILAKDHRNDIFANTFGTIFAVLSVYNKYLDPIAALFISLIIFRSWSSAVIEHSQLIVGKCADGTFIKRVIYITMTHSEKIVQVDTCRAYYSGSKVIVEVDIVLNPDTPLQIAHDLGETLQIKLESLPNVERAFVHCDYEGTHKPEHSKFA